jgi:hypothetical protein
MPVLAVSSIRTRHVEDQTVGIACIYCNYKEREAHTVVNLLASLCAQLASQHEEVSSELYDLYDSRIRVRERPTQIDVERLLDIESRRFSNVYIFVDALDGCADDGGTRTTFMKAIHDLPATVRVMITCRPHVLKHDLDDENALIEIRTRDEDVRRYLEQRRAHFPACVRRKDSLIRDAIDVIVSSVEGMFVASYVVTIGLLLTMT